MAINKVIYDGRTLIDLTGDNVTADKLLSGYTAHGADGEAVEGTCDFDVNSQDATATEPETLSGKTFYARGTQRTGTMRNNGGVTGDISTLTQQYTIPQGYHDGSGKVGIAGSEISKLVPKNIRQGITVLGVAGTMSGSEDVTTQSNKNAVPTTTQQIITPDEGYDYLGQVTIAPIPYSEMANAFGTTVTIG